MPDEKKRNGNGLYFYLKIVSIAIGIAIGAGALMRTYIVGPVADCAERAEKKADENAKDIGALKESAVEIKTNTDNISDDVTEMKGDLKEFMRKKGVQPTGDENE